MADKKFTFFEFHLHDSDLQFGPKDIGEKLGASLEGAEASASDPTGHEVEVTGEADGESSAGPSVAKALLALVVVVALAFAAKSFLGGDEELADLEELDETL
jgi:hypothetical protein